MRLLLTVPTVLMVTFIILPLSDAGMEDWFKGWGGKGKGRGGRRRPAGQYRPIYIHAPPIVQHAPSPSLYSKPVLPSYGYGAPAAKGFSSGGFATSYKTAAPIPSSYKAPAPITASFQGPSIKYGAPSNNFAVPSPKIPVTYGTGAPISHGSGGAVTSYGSGVPHTNEISYSNVGFGGGISGKGFPQKQGFGPIKNDDLIVVHEDNHAAGSYGDTHIQGMKAPQAGPPHAVHHGNTHQHGAIPYFDTHAVTSHSSHGSISHGAVSNTPFTSSHNKGHVQASHQGGLSLTYTAPVPHHSSLSDTFKAPAPHHSGTSQLNLQHGDLSYSPPHQEVKHHNVKSSGHVNFDHPPVYVPGSNSISSNIAPHFADDSIEASDVSAGFSLQTEYKADQQHIVAPHSSSAPLPMAEHGTSSLSYLETPPAPLYSLDNDKKTSTIVHKSSESFNPSKQIPFPGEVVQQQVIHEPQIILENQVQSIDVDASYSAPAVGISSAPQIDFNPASFGRQLQHGSASSVHSAHSTSEAVVSFDNPLDYTDPIIEIVFEEAPQTYVPAAPAIDPSLYQPQSDDVEVYFIEVSDDGTYETVDDLDLSSALAGVKEEFPDGLPPELSQTLLNSGFLDNAQIEVLDLQSALGDSSLDHSVRHALQEAYGSESQSIATVVAPPTEKGVELKLKRLIEDKETLKGDVELAKDLSGRFRQGRYGGVVELNDKDSKDFLPVHVDGKLIPMPDHPDLKGREISGVLVYADSNLGVDSPQANVVLSTSRRARQLELDDESRSDDDWKPILENKAAKS